MVYPASEHKNMCRTLVCSAACRIPEISNWVFAILGCKVLTMSFPPQVGLHGILLFVLYIDTMSYWWMVEFDEAL